MSILIVKHDENEFKLFGEEIINLELKLNVTPYGKCWKDIGQRLYDIYMLNKFDNSFNTIDVTFHQYNYLYELSKKNYKDVYEQYTP